jgi:hypothetical protein
LKLWPKLSHYWPFLNPLTVDEFTYAELSEYVDALADLPPPGGSISYVVE